MASVQYRVELNPLTKPASYKVRFLPQQTAGYDEVAARVALKNPGLSAEQIRNHLKSALEEIAEMLAEGMQVTLEEAITFRPSFHARLTAPDEPLPPMDELLRVSVSATRPFVRTVQAAADLERVATEEKAPSILSAADTTLELNNVLNPEGVLRLTGGNLFFDRHDPDCRCLIRGTESGRRVQNRFASISNSEILAVPNIPAQTDPWNNEYTVSVTTRYTEHGSLRTGTYGRKLRSPLTVAGIDYDPPEETGILTGSAAAPYVSITGGTIASAEQLRIEAEHNLEGDHLVFKLLDLRDGGEEGLMVPMTGNGECTLPGFAGSAVSALEIRVNDYAGLKEMVCNDYDGRLVDILDVAV